jgi:hypothetical protein
MLTCRRLALALLAFPVAAAQAQPAVPAVPPLRSTAAPAPAAAAARPAPAPVTDPDAPPTSSGAPAAAAPVATAPTAAPATAAADAPPTSEASPAGARTATVATTAATYAPPTSDAPPTSAPSTTVASATPNAAGTAPAAPAVPPTVTRNYPITPEGNARFLAEYAARPDVKKLEGGVLYRVLRAADPKSNGPIARGDTVTVSYRGWLIDGAVFDQTKPGSPVLFTLNGVVPGWRTVLMKMKVGDLWEVVVPADQAYGAEGRGTRIPPNQTLIFVISLAKVEYAG